MGAWVNSKMYTSILYNIIVMQGYFQEKIRTHLDLLSIPRLWGGNIHRIHEKLGIQLSF